MTPSDGSVIMRICMISGLAKYPGGVEHVVDELSSFMVNHNATVTVFGKYYRDFVESSHNFTTIGVRPYELLPPRLRFPDYEQYVYNLKAWRKTKVYGPFDLIHGHGSSCFFSSIFRTKKPFLMTFHGTMEGIFSKKYGSKISPHLFTVFYPEQVAALRCDLAVACSNAVKNELVTFYGVNQNKIAIIHNGVNVNKFFPQNKNLARRKLELSPKNKYALWIGTDPIRKGLSIAMKAVEKIPNIRLLVVGVSGNNFGKTIFLGKISEAKIIDAYNAADFLIFPTIYEGFPLVPLEALASGLPIIVSTESNLGEIIEEGVHGFVVKEGSPSAYKEKIEFLLNDDVILEKMSLECRNLAVNYSWKKQAEKYWKIYQRIIGS